MEEKRQATGTPSPSGKAAGAPTAMFLGSLKFKLWFALAAALAAATGSFAYLIIHRTSQELLDQAIAQNQQLAEVIRRSTRHAMLQNQQGQVERIIEAVSRTKGIEKIRILNKEGEIITSTLPSEVGARVDKNAEACYSCHAQGKPLQQIPGKDRHRIYRSAVGHRLLGTIDVVRNEPACYTAACHAHPEGTTVLGVLDIAYSLDEMDNRLRGDVLAVVLIAVLLVLITFGIVIILLRRLVYRPLEDLENGARLVSSGNRQHMIPVRSPDELGHLAHSFNLMTRALDRSERELQEWTRTLEDMVEEKIAELRIAEAKAVQTEKLASVGLLAAGIAHEINNPLTGVLTFAHLVRDKLPEGSPEAEDMEIIIRETKRCAGIIRRLLDFAREKKPEQTFSDLNQVLRETIQLVEHQVGFQNIEFATHFDPQLPPVWMDPNQMKQVFMNILVNGKEAMSEWGRFAIRTRRAEATPEGAGGEAARGVEISLADTGCGIPAADIPKIFDPFFTSKEPGKGVGLGLSVSYGIVRAHGGKIEVESAVGRGTTFRIWLPMEMQAKEEAKAGDAREDTRR